MKDIKVKKKKVTHETFVCPEPGCGFEGETKQDVLKHYAREHCVEEVRKSVYHLTNFLRFASRARALEWVEISFGADARDAFVWEGPGWYYTNNWRCYPARRLMERMQERIERLENDRRKLAADLGLEI